MNGLGPPTEEELREAGAVIASGLNDSHGAMTWAVRLTAEQMRVILWALGYAQGRQELPADDHAACNAMRLRVLLATLLQDMPAPKLGRIVEAIATMRGDQALESFKVATWYHEGFASLVVEMANTLQPKREP